MCAGAICAARMARLVYGAPIPGGGGRLAVGRAPRPAAHHQAEVIPGVLEGECSRLLREFFAGRRHAGG